MPTHDKVPTADRPSAPQARTRPGFTMLEIMVGAGISNMIFLGGYALVQTAYLSFDRNSRQSHADVDAALALQRVIADLREAQQFTPVAGGLDVTFPPAGANGWYDGYTLNLGGPDVSFFLADGKPDGTFTLKRRDWRITTDQNGDSVVDEKDHTRSLCRSVQSISCVADADLPNALIVTIKTKLTRDRNRAETIEEVAADVAKTTELKQRVICTRNYDPELNNP